MSAQVATPVVVGPVIKSVGGKTQLLPEILPRLPAKIETYYEPFAGGLAVFFALYNAGRFKRAVIGDVNPALANLYTQIRDNCPRVISYLARLDQDYSAEHFYDQRSRSLDSGPLGAARTIYLLKTCFNGLFRVNASGEFNSPFGKHVKKPRIVNAEKLYAASRALKDVEIVDTDFAVTVMRAGVDDAVFFDSPYIELPKTGKSKTVSFTKYTKAGFDLDDQERLADCAASVVKRGCPFVLSNSDTLESRRIFGRGQWLVESVSARRNINSDGAKRGAVGEILVSAPKRARKVVK